LGVEVTESHRIPDWQYREAEEGEQGGVLINLSPTGRVDVREGLVKRKIAVLCSKRHHKHI
jgi:ParB family transcriptional regulator, chromosome partitioning protein